MERRGALVRRHVAGGEMLLDRAHPFLIMGLDLSHERTVVVLDLLEQGPGVRWWVQAHGKPWWPVATHDR
jgi:hypothetical protein